MAERNLLVDLYAGDLKGKADWASVVATPDFVGAIIKATEGGTFTSSSFATDWPAIKEAGGDRYGSTWFRGAYHYLKFNKDGGTQADFYLDTIDAAGGFDVGDIIPIVDVELGNDGSPDKNGKPTKRNSNWDATGQQIIDCTSAFAERAKSRTGQQVMLYGNGAMRDKGITDRMGCDWLWIPRYTDVLPRKMYERAGWTLDRVAMWQYCGDNQGALKGYPTKLDKFAKVDISVVLFETLNDFLKNVCAQVITLDP
jgi:GH25 family lysozyme M1 (1,4-beta-N-acetylmuramidase)